MVQNIGFKGVYIALCTRGGQKISYAPSMAVLELTEEFKKEFCISVNRLDRVSVREKRSLPVLRKLTDKPVTVAVDPVLLLKDSDWLKEMYSLS